MNDSDYYKNKSREMLEAQLITAILYEKPVDKRCKFCGADIRGKQTTHEQDCLKLIASRIKALR